MRIYMAGPLFSTAECDFNASLAYHLRDLGHEVFLPQENEQGENANKIFRSDIAGIEWAELVLGNLDGPDPDSGTCWELGYGFAKGLHIGVYRTDFRIHKGFDPINLMMTESAYFVVLGPKLPVVKLAVLIDENIKMRWPKQKIKEISPTWDDRQPPTEIANAPWDDGWIREH